MKAEAREIKSAARQDGGGGDCGDKSSVVAQASVICRLLSHFAHARAARPASLREGMSLPRFDTAAKSCSLEPRPTLPSRPQLLSSPEDWCLICCLPADAAGEPGGPLYYKEVLTRFLLEFFYPHDSERECDRTIGSFSLQSGITREQLSLPLASPPSPSGIRGIRWVAQSIDLWLVSRSLDDTMKYSDRHLAGLSARAKAPRPRRTHRRGLSRLRDRPQLRLRANKLPSPNHCESRDFLLVFKNLSL